MNKNIEVTVSSPSHLLTLLGCNDFARYQSEFEEILNRHPDLSEEDWSCEPELLQVLYCITRHNKPHTIVEIGTYKGKSALIFAHALQNNNKNWGSIFTIDDNTSGTVDEAKKRFSQCTPRHRIHLLESSSLEAFSEWKRAKIDLLFIDGSHSYLNATCDFSLWSRHLSNKGLIVMHDTVTRLERCFPKDYIYPLDYYDVINVTDMLEMPSGQEWEGCGFISPKGTVKTD